MIIPNYPRKVCTEGLQEVLEFSSDSVLTQTDVVDGMQDASPHTAQEIARARLQMLDETLGRIATTQDQIKELGKQLDASVQDARTLGATWLQIGEAVRFTKQNAQRRWNPESKQKHAEYLKNKRQK